MAQRKIYSGHAMKNCVFTIDGREVTNFDEGDDVFSVAWTSEIGEPTVGADGCAIVSFSMDESATITIKLMQTSPFNVFLMNKAAQTRGGLQNPFSVAFTDTASGESGSGEQAVLIGAPQIDKGAKSTSREWKIFVPVWKMDQTNYGLG